jgi:hypothetical protein
MEVFFFRALPHSIALLSQVPGLPQLALIEQDASENEASTVVRERFLETELR